jgi:hypothetical protein
MNVTDWLLDSDPRSRALEPEAQQPGEFHVEMDEGERKPSSWNTLRAMRVLRWAQMASPA